MKKLIICLSILTFIIAAMPVMARPAALTKSTKVEGLSNFDSNNPSETLVVKVVEDSKLADKTILEEGYKVYFEVMDVKDPKRLKRNANFKLKAKYYIDNSGIKHDFEHETFAKYTTTLDKKDAAKSVALGVGGYFVKGLSTGVAAVEGAVKNPEGNRAKSSVVSAYKASPFSYVEKGESLQLNTGDVYLLKIWVPKFEDEDEDEDETSQDYTMEG